MDDGDADEDYHLCLRCRKTIIGLENYVTHRKTLKCKPVDVTTYPSHLSEREQEITTKNNEFNTDVTNIIINDMNSQKEITKINSTPYEGDCENIINDNNRTNKEETQFLTITDKNIGQNIATTSQTKNNESISDPSLKADDFFSLLELQSSSKITPTSFNTFTTSNSSKDSNKSDRNRSQYGIITRSKSMAKSKEIQKSSQITKEDESVNDNKINSSDSSPVNLELNASAISTDNSNVNKIPGLQTNDSDGVEVIKKPCDTSENFVAISMTGRSETSFNTSESFLQASEDMEEDMYEPDDEDDDDEEGVNPPRTHTGGKWKPGGNPNFGSNWKTEELWSSQPPPTYTGGKWKPPMPSLNDSKQYLTQPLQQLPAPRPLGLQVQTQVHQHQQQPARYPHHPPPGHTRGKWMPIGDTGGPTLRKAGNQVQYWCGVCNRRLSSRGLYERHLKSHLHVKRTRQERQLDEDLLMTVPIRSSRFARRAQRASSLITKQIVNLREKSGRARRTVTCEICGARVLRHQMGKHLVSQYHNKRAKNHPAAGLLILANVSALARQAPFQCSLCHFYCNSMSYLLRHWDSKLHTTNDLKVTGRYWCSLCRYNSDSSSTMRCHLISSNHQELVSLINRSVPIVVQKITMFKCPQPGCNQTYRLNAQLRQHSRLTGHVLTDCCTASDTYQEKTVCPQCGYVAHSRRLLNEHLGSRHNISCEKYFCSVCGIRFNSKEEAKVHRLSKEHKYKTLRRSDPANKLQRKCLYCRQILSDVPQLKTHLKVLHPDKSHRCIKCGDTFTLKQQLARHVRAQCKGIEFTAGIETTTQAEDDNVVDENWPDKTTTPFIDKWESSESISLHEGNEQPSQPAADVQCSKCPFMSASSAELLFHMALHNEPVMSLEEGAKPQNLVPKYVCPTCQSLFKKDSLKKHIQTHTGERPHSCTECGATFARNDVLTKHMRNIHQIISSYSSSSTTCSLSTPDASRFICNICDTQCSNRSSLNRHIASHHPRSKSYLCAECGSAFYDK